MSRLQILKKSTDFRVQNTKILLSENVQIDEKVTVGRVERYISPDLIILCSVESTGVLKLTRLCVLVQVHDKNIINKYQCNAQKDV